MLNIVYWIRGADYAEMAVKSAESMKRVYEGARVFVYADMLHEILESSAVDESIVIPYFNSTPHMIANLQAQVHYCLSSNFDRRSLLVDADTIAVSPAPLDSEKPWDLLCTWRDHVARDDEGQKIVGAAQQMPYNYGILALENTQGAREAMLWMRDRLKFMSAQLQAWYGNQWALRELVGGSIRDTVPYQTTRQTPWSQIEVRVERCDKWNYTPESADEDIAGKYFVHPKGERKAFFDPMLEKAAAA